MLSGTSCREPEASSISGGNSRGGPQNNEQPEAVVVMTRTCTGHYALLHYTRTVHSQLHWALGPAVTALGRWETKEGKNIGKGNKNNKEPPKNGRGRKQQEGNKRKKEREIN